MADPTAPDAVRRAWFRHVGTAVTIVVLLTGALTFAVAPAPAVRAVAPDTTTFADINPDNGGPLAGQPGLNILPCPDPCASQHNGGRVNGLYVALGFPDLAAVTYYAASEVGGLFKSVDGGADWTHLDGHVPHLTWDVAAEQGGLQVYATSFFDGRDAPLTGVEISGNGGQTWAHPFIPTPAGCSVARANQPSAFGIALRPDVFGEVLVGTNCGLARSADHGANWERFDPTPSDGVANSVWDVVALAGGRTYACGDDGLLMFRIGLDVTWQALGKPISTTFPDPLGGHCSLAVAPNEPTVVFVAFGDAYFADIVDARRPEMFEGRIDESDPSPVVDWTQLPYPDDHGVYDRKARTPFMVTNPRSAGFDPDNASAGYDLWVGDGSLWRIPCHAGQTPRCSTVKSKWSVSFTDHLGTSQDAHGDSGDLTFNPLVGVDACPTIYSSDGGVYGNALMASPSCQAPDFRGTNSGLHAFYLRGMTTFSPTSGTPEADEDVYIATQDNGLFYSANGGAQTPSWTHGIGGDVFDVAADDQHTVTNHGGLHAGDPGFANMVTKAGNFPGQPLWDSEAVVRAVPGRYILTVYSGFDLAGTPIPRGVRDVTDIDTAPMGTPFGSVPWPATADSPCHVQVAMGASGPVPYVLAGRCWYGTQNIPFGSSTGRADQLWTFQNEEWVERHPGPMLPGGTVSEDAGFSTIAVDPTDPLHVYASVLFDGPPRMMRSTDGGATWTYDRALTLLMNDGFEPNLGDPGDGIRVMPQPSLVAFDPLDPDIIVAGGRSSGVFISSDGGQHWALLTDPHTPGTSGIPHLPNPAFAAFDHDKPGTVRVYLGTGRGIWRIDLETADLAVTKVDAPDPVVVGANLTYTIEVTNAGPDMAQNATLEDEIPTRTRFQSVSAPAGWSCSHPAVNATGTVTCTNPSMAPGTASFQLVVRVASTVNLGAGITNTADVYSAAVDPLPADNTATATTAVLVPVAINIRPGGFPNSVNQKGQASVAVLTTTAGEYSLPLAFDATKINPLSVRFGPASVVLGGGGAIEIHLTGHVQDSFELDETTQDGDLDMLFHFKVADAGLTSASTQACVKGTFDGGGGATYTFFGCDSIKVVP